MVYFPDETATVDIGRSIASATEFAARLLRIPYGKVVTGKVFVTGGNGTIGYRVANRLLDTGYPDGVRVGFRQPNDECAHELSKKGADITEFSWTDEATYAPALEGVKIVFCVAPHVQYWASYFPAFLRACESAGVEYFVKISFFHARVAQEPFQQAEMVEMHGTCDKILSYASIPYTILSCSHYMSNPLVMNQHQDVQFESDQENPFILYGAANGMNTNYVSPNDVAEVATRVLQYSKPHMFKEYTLTGQKSISDDDVASAIAKHTPQRQVFYEDLPIAVYKERKCSEGGNNMWMVPDLVAIEQIKATGVEEHPYFVTNDIERLCQRKPETFHDYLEAKQHMTTMESWLFR